MKDQILFSKEISEEYKEEIKYILKRQEEHKKLVSVVYMPDCGCHDELLIQIDRYPMMDKIRYYCEKCKKNLASITNPIKFVRKDDDTEYDIKSIHTIGNKLIPAQEYYISMYLIDEIMELIDEAKISKA